MAEQCMDERIRRVIGIADACELMAATFRFPDEALAAALVDGSYASDAISCLSDAGAAPQVVSDAENALAGFSQRNADELLDCLKKGNSILYLAPGYQVPVWPYEAAFRYVASGKEGVPALFRSPITLDVEKHMRAAGAMPANSRTEPADSVWNEFAFLAFAYGSQAKAMSEGNAQQAQAWSDAAAAFAREHALQWLPAFMDATSHVASTVSFGTEYVSLSKIGSAVTTLIKEKQ